MGSPHHSHPQPARSKRQDSSGKALLVYSYDSIASTATRVWGHRIMGPATFEDLLSVRRSDTGDVEVDRVRWPSSYVDFTLASMNL